MGNGFLIGKIEAKKKRELVGRLSVVKEARKRFK